MVNQTVPVCGTRFYMSVSLHKVIGAPNMVHIFFLIMSCLMEIYLCVGNKDYMYLPKVWKSYKNKMCLWNIMPQIMANSNEAQDHKDKYFDTSRKILSQEMTMYNMEVVRMLSLRSYDQCQFFLYWSNVKVKRLSAYKKISSQGIFM